MRRTKKPPQTLISLVIPVYNEQERIKNLNALQRFIRTKKYIKECIVVNDGSVDHTHHLLEKMKKKWNIVVVSYTHNKGKGYAVKKGIERAHGTHVVVMDVDLSTSLAALDVVEKKAHQYPIIIGTRKSKDAHLALRQSKLREGMGRLFTFLSQCILGVWVSDFTCGFKCFDMRVAKKIVKAQHIYGWAYDGEYLYIGSRLGYPIFEIPVTWKNDSRTKVRFPQDVFTSLRDIIRIRIHHYGLRFK